MKGFRFCVVLAVMFTMAILSCASPARAGKKDDTLNIASQVEITNVDKYFNAIRVGTCRPPMNCRSSITPGGSRLASESLELLQ
jgi:hypothetical protein